MRRHPATYLLCSSALLIEYSSINVAPNLKRVPFDFRGKSKLLPQRLAFTCFHYPLQIFGFEQVNGRNCMMLSIVSVPGTFNSLNQLMLTQSWNAGTLSIWVLWRRKLRLREIKQLGQRYNIGIPGLNPSYWDSKVHALPLLSFASLARSDFAAANSPGQGSNLEAILNIRTALNWQHLLSVSFTTVFPEWGRDADTDIVDAQEIFSKQVNTFLFTWALTGAFLKHLRFGFNYGVFFLMWNLEASSILSELHFEGNEWPYRLVLMGGVNVSNSSPCCCPRGNQQQDKYWGGGMEYNLCFTWFKKLCLDIQRQTGVVLALSYSMSSV